MSLKEQYHTNHNVEHLLAPLLLIFWYNSFLTLKTSKEYLHTYSYIYVNTYVHLFKFL